MTLGKQLKAGRTRAGFTLRDVERETGISNGYLSQIESDSVKQPSPKNLYKLAAIYHLDYGHLMRLAGHVPIDIPLPKRPIVKALIAGTEDLTAEERQRVQEYVDLLKAARRSGQDE